MRSRMRTLTKEALSVLDKCLGLIGKLQRPTPEDLEETKRLDVQTKVENWQQETLKLLVIVLAGLSENEDTPGARYVRLSRRRSRKRRRVTFTDAEETHADEDGPDCG